MSLQAQVVVSLLDQNNTAPGIWCAAFDLFNCFLSIPIYNDQQKQFSFI